MKKMILFLGMLIVLSGIVSALEANEIISCYGFDTNSSTEVDYMGNYNLYKNGNPNFVTSSCVSGGCYEYNGVTGNYFIQPNHKDFDDDNDGLFFCGWFKANNTNIRKISFHRQETGWGGSFLDFQTNVRLDYGFGNGIDATCNYNTKFVYSANTLYHICISHNTTWNVMWVNGVKQHNASSCTLNGGLNGFAIGAVFNDGSFPFNGIIDEFMIGNKTGGLTQADVDQLYNNKKNCKDFLIEPFDRAILEKLNRIEAKLDKLESQIAEINQTTETTETSTSLILEILGKILNRTITLFQGWNLASSPYPTEKTINQSTASIEGCYQQIFAYNDSKWLTYNPLLQPSMNTLSNVHPNLGYWVKVNCSQVNWTIT